MSSAPPPLPQATVHVACLCAGWCRLCDDYGPVFESAVAALRARQPHPALQAHWIDIEDEAALVGDYDVETFPTLVVADERQVLFAGPLTPQPDTLRRVLRAALAASADLQRAARQPAEVESFADRLRQRLRPASA